MDSQKTGPTSMHSFWHASMTAAPALDGMLPQGHRAHSIGATNATSLRCCLPEEQHAAAQVQVDLGLVDVSKDSLS